VAGLRLVVRALELVLLTTPTRLRLQLLAFFTATALLLLLLATLAALLISLIAFLRHPITPCCKDNAARRQAFLPLTQP
jgi:hypothetical protein